MMLQRTAPHAVFLVCVTALRVIAAQGDEIRPSVVKVRRDGTGYHLERDGKPYVIRGAGGRVYLEALKEAGGNSIRTWGEDDLEPLLDRAHELGLTVTVGIWLGQERQGFNYADPGSVRREVEKARRFFRRYRGHPALLMWGLGNEMEGSGDNPVIWGTVNEIARIARTEDPNHPTMTVIAEAGGRKIAQYLVALPRRRRAGYQLVRRPADLAEAARRDGHGPGLRHHRVRSAGPLGGRQDALGCALEPTSTEKAKGYLAEYTASIAGQAGRCLGSYAFLWGHKQEATATWFGMFLPSGERLGAVDAMTFAWTGRWPANRTPEIRMMNADASEGDLPPSSRLQSRSSTRPTRTATRSSSAGRSARRALTGVSAATARRSRPRTRSASSRRRALAPPSARRLAPGATGFSLTSTTARAARPPRTCRSL